MRESVKPKLKEIPRSGYNVSIGFITLFYDCKLQILVSLKLVLSDSTLLIKKHEDKTDMGDLVYSWIFAPLVKHRLAYTFCLTCLFMYGTEYM